MLMFLGQRSGCIDSGRVMARRTISWCPNFLTRYVLPRICTSPLYTQVAQKETGSNCMGRGQPHKPTYWD
jgi:hypothetical protein